MRAKLILFFRVGQQHIFRHHWSQTKGSEWGSAWKCSVRPRQEPQFLKMLYWTQTRTAVLTWHLKKGLSVEHSRHETVNCVTLICMYNNSISQHLSKEMRLSLSNEWTSYSEQASFLFMTIEWLFHVCSSPLSWFPYLNRNCSFFLDSAAVRNEFSVFLLFKTAEASLLWWPLK